MRKIALFLILILALGFAITVRPDFRDSRDRGSESLEALNVGLSVDCDTKALSVDVEGNESGNAIAGASVYLFYTDYEYQLIASGATGSDGIARINVLGTRDYLTKLYILRVEKPGYRSKEIEFTYEKCFQEQPAPEPPANNTTPSQPPEGNTTPPANDTPPSNGTGPLEPPQTPGNGSEPPQTPPATPPPASPSSACPLGLLVLAALLISARS
jgi:hypothetical protein